MAKKATKPKKKIAQKPIDENQLTPRQHEVLYYIDFWKERIKLYRESGDVDKLTFAEQSLAKQYEFLPIVNRNSALELLELSREKQDEKPTRSYDDMFSNSELR